MPSRLLFAALWISGGLPALAGGIAVLVDVSGTMKQYGAWQDPAVGLVERILNGSAPDSAAWRTTGDPAAAAGFRMQAGAQVQLVRFGSTERAEFPFFGQVDEFTEAGRIRRGFPLGPEAFRQARTNKTLALAVGAKLAEDQTGEARVLIISDFLVDSDLTADQLEFVNEFESRARIESPVIFSWTGNPRVQVKLLRIHTRQAAPARTTLQLLGARLVEANPRRVQFLWKVEGPAAPKSFDVVVRDAKSRKVVWSAANVMGSTAAYPKPSAGRRTWQVKARLEDGSEVVSLSAPFEVKGGGLGPFAWVLALASLGGGLYYLSSRRPGRKPKTGGGEWKI